MFQVKVDPQAALGWLSDLQQRQIPFAISLGLNWISTDAQTAERERLKRAFKLRREAFNLRGVKIARGDRATKTSQCVIIQVAQETQYLEKFESDGMKVPVGGRRYLWIPNDKVFKNKVISPDDPLRPRKLNLHRDPHGRIIGDQRTFMIHTQNGQTLVLQRTGKSGHKGFKAGSMKGLSLDNVATGMGPRQRTDRALQPRKVRYGDQATIKLYTLKARVRVPVKLEFFSTISKSVESTSVSRFRQAMDQAMRTAR
jgi:hypothetical protein